VNREHLYKTLDCESGGFKDVKIQSQYFSNGVQERSFGVAQINLDAHPDITYEEAIDPVFAIDYAAKEFSKGNAKQWTCWSLLFTAQSASAG
jgi:hypothetical protein